jgi:hypothetical protein
VDVGSISLRLLLQLGVGLNTADKLLAGAGQGDVLDTEVDTLLDVTVLDLLVDDNTDSRLGDVVDDAGLSVIDLVWHTVYSQHKFLYISLVLSDSRRPHRVRWCLMKLLTPFEQHRWP